MTPTTPSNAPSTGDERRRAVRVECPLEAMYSSDSPPIRARIQDLSEVGLFLDTTHPLAVGSEVRVSFDLPDGKPTIEADARVAWSAPMMGIGIEFSGMSEETKERIKFHVADVFFSNPIG